VKKIEAIIKPFKLDEVKERFRKSDCKASPSPRPGVRAAEGSRRTLFAGAGIPSWTFYPRLRSRS